MTVRVLGPRAVLASYLMLLLAYLAGAVVPLMNDEAALHAGIALHIHETGDWTRLVTQGRDYLDKPHLLFWLSALSFEVFGIDAVAFKLPTLLFSMLAVYATTRLGELLHNETSGRLAGLILASAFALLLANSDARMDALLIGSIIFASWQLIVFVTDDSESARRAHLVVGGAGMALGLAAKGMIGVVMPLAAVFLYLVYRLDWRRLFDPFWLVLPLVVLLFATPVLYAYYEQFGMDGVRYILWSQSIERLAGERYASIGSNNPFFFYYTYLWAFLPWSLITLWSLVSSALRLTNDRYWPRAQGEAVTLGMIVTVFILLSLSKFRLPHYVGVLLPFFAIQLAGWLPARLRHRRSLHHLWQMQYVVFALLLLAAILFNGWMFPLQDGMIGVTAAIILVLGIWAVPRWLGGARLVIASVSAATAFWLLANFNVYPRLLDYQAGTVLGNMAMSLRIAPANLYYLDGGGRAASFDIATRRLTPTLTLDELARREAETVLFVTAEGRETIEAKGLPVDVMAYSPDYRVSRLRWKFLNPNTRAKELGVAYLLRVPSQASEPGP